MDIDPHNQPKNPLLDKRNRASFEEEESQIVTEGSYKGEVLPENEVVRKKSKKRSKRCPFPGCKKKLALTDSECRCGSVFCIKHRLPETHECTFNYKDEKKELQRVVGEKLERI